MSTENCFHVVLNSFSFFIQIILNYIITILPQNLHSELLLKVNHTLVRLEAPISSNSIKQTHELLFAYERLCFSNFFRRWWCEMMTFCRSLSEVTGTKGKACDVMMLKTSSTQFYNNNISVTFEKHRYINHDHKYVNI